MYSFFPFPLGVCYLMAFFLLKLRKAIKWHPMYSYVMDLLLTDSVSWSYRGQLKRQKLHVFMMK